MLWFQKKLLEMQQALEAVTVRVTALEDALTDPNPEPEEAPVPVKKMKIVVTRNRLSLDESKGKDRRGGNRHPGKRLQEYILEVLPSQREHFHTAKTIAALVESKGWKSTSSDPVSVVRDCLRSMDKEGVFDVKRIPFRGERTTPLYRLKSKSNDGE